MSHFATALSEILEQKEWTQTELSNRSGVVQPNISRWLSVEGDISEKDLEKICKVLRPAEQGKLVYARISDVLSSIDTPGKKLVTVSLSGAELFEDGPSTQKIKLAPKFQKDIDVIIENIPSNHLVRDMVSSLAAHLRRK